jgi:toxin-antitoxin system PIN domain toxin
MKKKPLLPDVNLWISLSFRTHSQHASANAWFTSLGSNEALLFCRTTQQGFLRLSTNPKVLPKEAVSLTDAWKLYDSIRLDPRVGFAAEPVGLEVQWRSYSHGSTFSPNVWTDTYLAAFAKVADYELVSFDKGFARHPGLVYTQLS